MLRIVLADDHTLVRKGFRLLLESEGNITVVGECGDGHSVLPLVAQLQPDLVILDVTMPGLNGLEALEHIVRDHPTQKVLMLSMHAADEYVLRALRLGARGYLLKDAADVEMLQAVQTVANGGIYLSPAVAGHLIEDYRRLSSDHSPEQTTGLTLRQREVLQLLAEGHTSQQIANHLGINKKTVDAHRQDIMERLNIRDVPGLVRYAMRIGLIHPES